MTESKQNWVAVIAGVGPGLGSSLARRFTKDYAVVINARSADYLRSLAAEIRKEGGHVLEVQADVSNQRQSEAAVNLIRERLGEPEVLIYNAAAGPLGGILDVSPEQFENSLRGNALGRSCVLKSAPRR